MRFVLALAASLAFLPSAYAAEKGDKQFTPDLEFRLRYVFEDNQSATGQIAPNNGNNVEQRLKVGGQYKFSEKFSVTARLIHAALWGSQDLYVFNTNGTPGAFSSGDAAGIKSGASGNNLLTVNEAYGSWLVSDDFVLRFGRGGLTLADGSVISTNDWQPVPTSFDGVLGTYEFDFGRISGWVIKFSQYSNGSAAKAMALGAALSGGTMGAVTSGSFESDPEANAYGLAFDLKKMPEWLKMVNIHVIQNTKATTPGAFYTPVLAADPTTRMGQNILRYGLAIGGAAGMFDYKADFAGMSGKYFCQGGIGTYCAAAGNNYAITDMNANGYMAQAELGVNFPEFMKARIFGRYHYDSGNDENSSTGQSSVKTYDPYFYDRHAGSGHMEVIGWGNLSFASAGLSVSPTDQTNVTLQYYMFQKTDAKGRINPGRFGDMMAFTSSQDNKLGQEIDLVAEHKYDGGFTILTSVGMFMPGSSVKNGLQEDPHGPTAVGAGLPNANRDNVFTQVMVQGKMGF